MNETVNSERERGGLQYVEALSYLSRGRMKSKGNIYCCDPLPRDGFQDGTSRDDEEGVRDEGLKVRQRNVNREGGRLGAMRQVGNGKARVRGAWVQSLGRTSRVQGFKASEVGEMRHNDVLGVLGGGGGDWMGLGFAWGGVARDVERGALVSIVDGETTHSCRPYADAKNLEERTRVVMTNGGGRIREVGVQGESCRRYNGRQPKVKSNIKGEGERERERERDIWEGGRVALRVDEEATTRGGVGKLSSDVLWLGDVGGRGRAGGRRDCGLETWWWRRKSDVARLMAVALTADYAAANKSGAGGAVSVGCQGQAGSGKGGTKGEFKKACESFGRSRQRGGFRKGIPFPQGCGNRLGFFGAKGIGILFTQDCGTRFGGGWFFGAFCSRMVAGTDLGGSDFFQCKGDFVPAALRERNFFGGEHDFPVMKVELGGEWS
ncbi:hypothetical protein B0H13DRAFT_2575059 [Mycena leptocephala]|nr:hypothetical protein B0H13DRAFT_2575059 [Mycena leptocephala]